MIGPLNTIPHLHTYIRGVKAEKDSAPFWTAGFHSLSQTLNLGAQSTNQTANTLE